MMGAMSIGEAVRVTYEGAGLTQQQLAERLGAGVDQPTVSKMVRNQRRPSLEEIRAIEDAAGVPHGAVLRAAGFVDLGASVPDAIAADPGLTPVARSALVAAYEVLVGHGDDRS